MNFSTQIDENISEIFREKSLDISRLSDIIMEHLRCGCSSSGRAPPCQGGGSEFEPRHPLQKKDKPENGLSFFVFWHLSSLPLVSKGRWHGEAVPEGIRTSVTGGIQPLQQSWMENSTGFAPRTPGQGRQFKNSSISQPSADSSPSQGSLWFSAANHSPSMRFLRYSASPVRPSSVTGMSQRRLLKCLRHKMALGMSSPR